MDATQRQLNRINTYGPLVRYLGAFNEERVLVSDPQAIRRILLSNSYNYKKMDRFAKMYHIVLGEGLLTSDGKVHQDHRKMINKSIKLRQIKGLMPVMMRSIRKLTETWVKAFDVFDGGKGSVVVGGDSDEGQHSCQEFTDYIHCLNDETSPSSSNHLVIDVLRAVDQTALDIIGLAAFGIEFSSPKYIKKGLSEAYRIVTNGGIASRDLVMLSFFPGYFEWPFDRCRRNLNALNTLWAVVKEQVRLKQEAMRDIRAEGDAAADSTTSVLPDQNHGQGSGTLRRLKVSKMERTDSSSDNADDTNNSKEEEGDRTVKSDEEHVDFLSAMIQHNLSTANTDDRDTFQLSSQQLLDQCMTFLSAGHDTSAASLTWLLYLLSTHPEVQTRLRQELLTLSTDDGDKPYTYEAINQLPYLDAVVTESMRVFPSVPVTARVAVEDDALCDQLIPAGTTVVIHMAALQRLKSVWGPDAEDFVPERWLDKSREAELTAAKWTYLPFISGTRVCVGQKFALLEIKMLVHALVSGFVFEPLPGFRWKKALLLAWKPIPGMKLIVSRYKAQ
ncbi:hypothetical protein EC991_006210 [Linnemannia zychae]|nr:hypothetical protein EC991_006210 [Linnemannia zychae]